MLGRPVDHAQARLLLRQAGELAGGVVHQPVGPDHRELGEVVVATDLEVGRVVARRDLERTGPELAVDALVGDHRNAPLDERNHHFLADQVAVAVVVRMHGDRDVGEDRRRPHRCDRDVAGAVGERVADVREGVVFVLVLDLEVGESGPVARAPVDDPVRPIDPAALVEVDEPAHDGAVVALVHREPRAPVVERGAELAELAHDRAAVALEPVLDVGVEAVAAQVALAPALLRERAADRRPGRDARVVVAGLEERVEAAHPVPADERVLERELQAVADRQRAGDVRRRVHDDERLSRRVGVDAVEALLLPGLLPALLDALRFVERIHARDVVRQRL